MSEPIHTATLKIFRSDNASPPAFHRIVKVNALDPVGSEKSLLDVTTFDSTQKEYVAGLRDGSDLSLKAVWDPEDADGQVALKADYDSNAPNRLYRVYFPKGNNVTGTLAEFEASIQSCYLEPEVDNVVRLSTKLKMSGPVAWSTWTELPA